MTKLYDSSGNNTENELGNALLAAAHCHQK
jgi:hypothetical protein